MTSTPTYVPETFAPSPSATAATLDPGGGFIVEVSSFSGPLDLLLSLIREEQLDIYDIPIARICEQFVVRIRTLGLNEAAEYLEMAARLLRIKAQMLLPHGDEEQWEDPRAELVRRLLEYQQMREVVDLLERRGRRRGSERFRNESEWGGHATLRRARGGARAACTGRRTGAATRRMKTQERAKC